MTDSRGGFFMRGRWMALIVLIILFVAAVLLARRYPWVNAVVQDEVELRELIASKPLQAWAIGFGIYFVLSLIPGTGGKAVVCGWLFGFWPSVVMANIALTLAAVTMFTVSRVWFREMVRARFAEQVYRIDQRFKKYGATNLLVLRTMPVPYTLINYVTGAMDVPYRTFTWTTLLGLLPSVVISVIVGTQLPTLRELQMYGLWGLLDTKLLAAVAAMFAFSALAHLLVRWNSPMPSDDSEENMTGDG